MRDTVEEKAKSAGKSVGSAGRFSTQVGALAGELQRNREAANNGKHRSPIEVALQGLTARH